jgi:predicted AAA+ superfamily ATPase
MYYSGMVYQRVLALKEISKSVFLLGPRLTGKSWLLRHEFPDAPYFDLLRAETFLRLSLSPRTLRDEVAALPASIPASLPIVVDEIQKLPLLLDEIQSMIEENGWRFILTGSSARKLKRAGTNLLGGRARIRRLHPLCHPELGQRDLQTLLTYGKLPSIVDSDDPKDDLAAYCGTYLLQEIAAEGLSRRIDAFARFLRTVAIMNGQQVNYEAWASDAAVPARTIREYFTILSDTLLGEMLEPWQNGNHRKATSTGKFYLFDTGVCNTLAGTWPGTQGSETFGRALEHYLYTELRAWLDYTRDDRMLSFWRTRDGREVDFIVGDDLAIEVKGTSNPSERHLSGLREIAEEGQFRNRILVCMVAAPRIVQDVLILSPGMFLDRLWAGEF